MKILKRFIAILIFSVSVGAVSTAAQTNEFTYQGKLTEGGASPTGQFDFGFFLCADVSSVPCIGSPVFRSGVQMTAGIFKVTLDFTQSPFESDTARYLEIHVRPGGSPVNYMRLDPRQPITSAPYAIKTLNAASADALSSACSLCITDAKIQSVDGSKITGTVANAVNATNAMTATNAGNVTGTVPIANGGTGSSTQNFVDLSTNQSNIAGSKFFTGTLGGNGSGLTNLNGANLSDGSVTSSKIADEAVTENKLSPDQQRLLYNARNLSQLAMLRWDLLKAQSVVPVGNLPEGIVFDGLNMWVANTNSNSVTKIRASDGAVLATYEVGNQPRYIAFDGLNIWVTTFNSVRKVQASDGKILAAFSFGGNLRGICFDGANIWVARGTSSGRVVKINVENSEPGADFEVVPNPVQIAFDGANIWVTSSSSTNITKLRASDGAHLGTFNAFGTTFGIAFDGSSIWVSSFHDRRVYKLRASDGQGQGEVVVGSVGDILRGIVFDGTNIWVTNSTAGNVTKIRPNDRAILDTLQAGNVPIGVAFDGSRIWTTNSSGNNVTRLSPFPR